MRHVNSYLGYHFPDMLNLILHVVQVSASLLFTLSHFADDSFNLLCDLTDFRCLLLDSEPDRGSFGLDFF